MKITEQDNMLIKKYLRSKLTDEDHVNFKKRLDEDFFRDELLGQAKLIDALHLADETLLKEGFKKLDTKSKTSNGVDSKKSSSNKFTKYAFILLLLTVLSFLAYNYFNNSQEEFKSNSNYASLIDKYRFRYDNFEVKRNNSDNNEEIKSYNEALKQYANGDYNKALALFEKETPPPPEVKLYIVNCHLYNKDYQNALNHLGTISENVHKDILHNKDWYTVLGQLGLGKKTEAEALLNQIKLNKSHLFNYKSIELLRVLGNQ